MKQIQLKIQLKDIRPPIWRRVVISSGMSLLELHDLIQMVFGWEDRHLFIFEVGPFRFVNPDHWEEDAYKFQSAPDAILEDIVPRYIREGKHFNYEYDMGDGWQHDILVEKIYLEDQYKVPLCIDGRRACPPEDVGGPYGYDDFIEVLNDPSHSEHQYYKIWIGGHFDPEKFDLNQVNRGLKTKLKNKQIIQNSFWRKGDAYFYSVSFSSDWTKAADPKNAKIAESLPLRRDMVSLLEYVRDHSVKGTKATGNFPRKHVRAISAKLVNPPELDLVIGDRVYEMQSEDEVQELMFLHLFANTAGLIYGAEGLVWEVTSVGEAFLESDPVSQVWYLTAYWLKRIDWYFFYPFNDYSDLVDINTFTSVLMEILLDYLALEQIHIDEFIENIDDFVPGWITARGNRRIKDLKASFLRFVLINPFDKLGIIEVQKLVDPKSKYEQSDYFCLTNYGRSLLLSIE